MVLGVLPLVIASGAGASGRRAMGIVIFTGLSIGTLFTLFVVPAMYAFIAADHRKRARSDLPEAAPPIGGEPEAV
jgi:multidrug efflux pump